MFKNSQAEVKDKVIGKMIEWGRVSDNFGLELYIYGVGEVWFQLFGCQGVPALLLFLFYLNVSGMHP